LISSHWRRPLLAAVLLVVPVFEIGRWIRIASNVSGGQAERVVAYLAPLPAVLQNTSLVTVVQIGFCLAAVAISFKGLDLKGLPCLVSLGELGVSALLLAWLLFSLM